jgi:purine-binding chemotaxis protein CheW
MTRKSKIKTTLDTLFTGGKVAPSIVKKEPEKKQETGISVEQSAKEQSTPTSRKAVSVKDPVIIPVKPAAVEPASEMTSEKPKAEMNKIIESPTAQPEGNKPFESKVDTPAEQALRIAAEIDNANLSGSDDDEHLVIFSLGNELYGVTIHSVESIIKMQAITEVPRTEDYVLGVTNLRGTVVPVLDLRRRFNMTNIENTVHTRIIIINSDSAKVGIVVDEVTEVLKISQKTIQPPPPMSTTIESAYINGIARINDSLVILLDLEKILQSSSRKFSR